MCFCMWGAMMDSARTINSICDLCLTLKWSLLCEILIWKYRMWFISFMERISSLSCHRAHLLCSFPAHCNELWVAGLCLPSATWPWFASLTSLNPTFEISTLEYWTLKVRCKWMLLVVHSNGSTTSGIHLFYCLLLQKKNSKTFS